MACMQMPGNAVGGHREVTGGRINGGWENLHLSEPHSPAPPRKQRTFANSRSNTGLVCG